MQVCWQGIKERWLRQLWLRLGVLHTRERVWSVVMCGGGFRSGTWAELCMELIFQKCDEWLQSRQSLIVRAFSYMLEFSSDFVGGRQSRFANCHQPLEGDRGAFWGEISCHPTFLQLQNVVCGLFFFMIIRILTFLLHFLLTTWKW